MAKLRTASLIAAGIGLLVTAPALAGTPKAPEPVKTAAVAAEPASGETRDIVQTAFFQALTTPAPTAPAAPR